MRATLTFFVIVAGMLATAQADAQGEIPPSMTTPRAMTLAEAIAYAKAHQPAVLTGIARVTARQKAASVPRAQWYPSFGATLQTFAATANNSTASYVTQGSVDIPRIGGESVSTGSSWQPEALTFVGAGARQEVYDFGRIAAEVAATDELVDVEKQASANALLDVTYSVEEAYFAVHAAKAVLTAAEDAYTRAKSHRDLAKSGVRLRHALSHRADARRRRSRPVRRGTDSRERRDDHGASDVRRSDWRTGRRARRRRDPRRAPRFPHSE